MRPRSSLLLVLIILFSTGAVSPTLAAISDAAAASPFHFSSGQPDGKVGMASRPAGNGKIEIEAGDDFNVTQAVTIKYASFTGLLTSLVSSVNGVRIELYRIFPSDSTNPASGNVPTRINSPSDVSFDARYGVSGGLNYTATVLNPSFTVANSIVNGINKIPNQRTGGEGPVSAAEVQFNVTFNPPFAVAAGHFFFVPQVLVTGGEFLWISSPRPIVSGTPFIPDLETWIRNANLDPDWLRVGTDIIGSGTFNGAFSLDGTYSGSAAPVFQVTVILAVVIASVVIVHRKLRISA